MLSVNNYSIAGLIDFRCLILDVRFRIDNFEPETLNFKAAN
jgi:hypothetical protein